MWNFSVHFGCPPSVSVRYCCLFIVADGSNWLRALKKCVLRPRDWHSASPTTPYYADHAQAQFHCLRVVWTEAALERLSANTDCAAAMCICCIRNKFSGFYTVGGSFVFSLLVLNKLLEPDKHLKLKMDCSVPYSYIRDGFTGRYCNGPAVCAVFGGRMCGNVFHCAALTLSVLCAICSVRFFALKTKKEA